MTATSLAPTPQATSGHHEDLAHIVARASQHESAEARCLRSRVTGVPVVALCGHTYVPTGDPRVKPVCPRCAALYASYVAAGDAYVVDPRDLPV